ncbi:hypothetical protein ACFWM1_15055 [Nocardia sp. NPDC058379]|uniref:hypothetical protein n=1 Tax=unclassified Nocardia TaxID=2637762 RepID=UPI003648DC69
MTTITDPRPGPLTTVLRVDGWSTALFGVVLTVSAPLLREPLGLPTPLSLLFGVVLVAGGAALLAIARRGPHRYARPVVAVNAASALGMTALACSGLLPLTGLGVGFLLTGAALVAMYAALEGAALRVVVR